VLPRSARRGVSAHAAPSYEWQTTTPAEAGFAPGFAQRVDQFAQSGRVPNIHGIIIVRRGGIVLERYYEGDDQVWDEYGRRRTERIVFSAQRNHDLRSVTKSIVGLLVVVVVMAGNYNVRGRAPDDLFTEVILPSIR
jgi:CubicO group peptidase (beta-lactamase class C family)